MDIDSAEPGSRSLGEAARQTVWLVGAKTAAGLASFVVLVAAAGIQGPVSAGLITIGSVVAQYVSVVFDFGSSDLLLVRTGRRERLRALIHPLRRSKAGLAFLILALGLVVLLQSSHLASVTAIGCLYGIGLGLGTILSARLASLGKAKFEFAISWIEYLVIVGASLAALTQDGDPWLILLFFGVGRLGGNAARVFVAGDHRKLFESVDDGDRPATVLAEGFPFFAFTLAQVVFLQSDVLLLELFRSTHVVGIYQVAWRIAYYTLILGEALYTILLPRVAGWHKRGDAVRGMVRRLIPPYLALGVLVAVSLWLAAPLLIEKTFGPEFEAGVGLLRILALGIPLRFCSYALTLVLAGTGRQYRRLAATGIYTVLTLVALGVGAAAAGARGAAIARVAGEAIVLICYLGLLGRPDDAISDPAST